MKKAKFVQDAKLDPARYYRNPSDVIRDRRLTNKDRLDILKAWERDARERHENEEFASSGSDELQRLRRVREELERNPETAGVGSGVPRAEDA
jgi:Arc/MetJ-type ribon-helix-helix transcriptional regulator